MIYAWLASSQLPVRMEECTSTGRMDMTIELEKLIYIIEFKVDKKADQALTQIKEKEYAMKFTGKGKKIILIGISFDPEKRCVADFVWEQDGQC